MTLEARSALGGFADLARLAPGFNDSASSVELIERADIGCLLCTTAGDPDLHRTTVRQIAGIAPPATAGEVTTGGLRRAIWMTPRSWLLLCALGDEDDLIWAFADAFADRSVHSCRYSDQLCWLELSGDNAEGLLRSGSFLSLDGSGLAPGTAKRGLLAGIAVVFCREEQTRWLLGIERSRAIYMADWLAEAAHQQQALRGRR
jgi:heterotetrameric sarcosine oxidase gamma subunit